MGLGPSVPVLPGAHLPGTTPPSWIPGRGQTGFELHSVVRPPVAGVGRGVGTGPEPHGGTGTRSLSRLPGRQPAPPQHQGSREALPRQRLSLRCQALWMRLRASSNFLLEAS